MNINQHNYEAFFLDYFEGNLSPSGVSELMSFLNGNPDLKAEFNEFKTLSCPHSNSTYSGKGLLKKTYSDIDTITSNNFDELCIAKFENDLDDKTEQKLQQYIYNNPDKSKDYTAYSKVFLKPDRSLRFAKESTLKKFYLAKTRKRILYAVASIAAMLIVFFSLYQYHHNLTSNEYIAITVTPDKNEIPESDKNIEIPVNIPTNTSNNIVEQNENESSAFIVLKTNEVPGSNTNKKETLQNSFLATKLESIDIVALNNNHTIHQKLSIPSHSIENNHYDNNLYPDFKEFALGEIREFILDEDIESNTSFTFWDIAEAGVRTINRVTGAKITLHKKATEDGKLSALAINSTNFEFSTTRRKNK